LIAKVTKFAPNNQQQMKTTKIFYWVLTAIVALMMAFSCYSYLTKPEMAAAFP
jgi:hypothetical protein